MDGLFSLEGKVALVTGGAGMLGMVHGSALAKAGARVVLADLPGAMPEERARELTGDGGFAIGHVCDVSDETQVCDMVSAISERFGHLDVLVNDAGIAGWPSAGGFEVFGPFEDYPMGAWDAVLKANLTGTFLVCREAGKLMKAGHGGSIINISSIYGIVGPDHRIYEGLPFSAFVSYAVSKAGVLGLTRWLATYWASHGIRVNAVIPGGIYNGHDQRFVERYSNRTPMGRMADRSELAGIVVFLASEASSYCTGQQFVVDGGLSAW